MKIEEMFLKPITRNIQGVVIVGEDDKDHTFQELDEYVVTNELVSHFRTFFNAYTKSIHGPVTSVGVWIQGFYGSGKSHLLKIISYLLENKVINGKQAISFFTEGGKITDEVINANIKLAGSVPTDVILFNIDSRNSTSSNRNKDSILNVFLSVFNKHQGLYDKSPYIADLERKLIADGKYEEFQRVFKDISGKEWKKSRAEIAFMEKPFTNALVQVADMSESTSKEFYKLIIKKDAYELSINDFAEKVNDYCKSKGDNHHVVFLVDEVGQYIGDDSRLLLNLQTLVEDLSTKCKVKAWVIVTSQQAID